jgi:hypothetical protein
MKQKYPSIPARNYYWVQSESYSGGDSIRVYLNQAPEEFFKTINKELNAKFEEGNFDGMTDSYNYTKAPEKSEEGMIIEYGTKYLFVNNYKPSDSDAGSVDWASVLSQKSTPPAPTSARTSSTPARSYPMGEVLKDCAGWIIYKKTLPDGRIVYNVKIKPDTPKNRGDWNVIKGEIYTETGFKWGKFGAFEKWGQIASEAFIVNKLCEILGKYYIGGDAPASVPSETPASEPQNGRGKSISIYINGLLFSEAESLPSVSDLLAKKYGQVEVDSMQSSNRIVFDEFNNRVDVLEGSFVYGSKWGVPKKYGNELQLDFI